MQVDLIDSNETITAIRYEDLRAQLQARYQADQRALDEIATRCGYSHDGDAVKGSWIGSCKDGLAHGAGMGVLKDIYGRAVEYYGYAQNGRPQGPGYLIIHKHESSHSIEGNFDKGRADGVMRVSKAGKDDAIRNYKQGRDIGKAASGQNILSPFDGL